jgi:hypothetical protein
LAISKAPQNPPQAKANKIRFEDTATAKETKAGKTAPHEAPFIAAKTAKNPEIPRTNPVARARHGDIRV